jgi:predicted porin
MFNLGETCMKKSLVALAALTAVGAASAQSSVTLFGVLDAAVSGTSNKSQNVFGQSLKVSQSTLRSSGMDASRLGFRGSEDLGGGLAASFWLEGSINVASGSGVDNGGLKFNRRSTVSLSGPFGEVRLGRDYTPTFWNDTVFDPFGTNGVGTNLIATASGKNSPGVNQGGFADNQNYQRASNSVGYFLPSNLGGFYGQLMYSFNNSTSYAPGYLTPPGAAAIVADPALLRQADNNRAGRYIGGRAGYASGPLDIALAYGQSTIASNYYLGSTTNLDIWNLGASYDFGVVKLMGEYSDNKLRADSTRKFLGAGSNPGAHGWLLGATVPVGSGLIRASYSAVNYRNTELYGFNAEPKASKFALGYVYNLSKRTALYATVAHISNKNGADLTVGGPGFIPASSLQGVGLVPKSSIGYDLGIRHSF